MCPNGIRRTFNPKNWEHGTPVLVFGELMALLTAAATIPIAIFSDWPHGQLLLYAAGIIGAGALCWYAFDKSTLGEMPLTGTSARRIAAVIEIKKAEDKIGKVVKWDTISGDGTEIRADMTRMKPEYQKVYFDVTLASELSKSLPDFSRDKIDEAVRSLPEALRQQLTEVFLQHRTDLPFRVELDTENSDGSEVQ